MSGAPHTTITASKLHNSADLERDEEKCSDSHERSEKTRDGIAGGKEKQKTKRETGESVSRDTIDHDARGIMDLSLKKQKSVREIRKLGQVKLQIKIIKVNCEGS